MNTIIKTVTIDIEKIIDSPISVYITTTSLYQISDTIVIRIKIQVVRYAVTIIVDGAIKHVWDTIII